MKAAHAAPVDRQPALEVLFVYPVWADLHVSVQERTTGRYYDFASKTFVMPDGARDFVRVFRAGLIPRTTHADPVPLYGAAFGRSAGLHGQYVVTVRDMDREGVIVATLLYAVDNGVLATDAAAYAGGLANYEVEKGIGPPVVHADGGPRAGRHVELD